MSAGTTKPLLERIEQLAAATSDSTLGDALRRLKTAAQSPTHQVRTEDLRTALSSSTCVPVVIALAHSAGWTKQIAKICGKAGVAGAVVDGGAGGLRAASLYSQGAIDGHIAVKHVGAEAGCGFVTSSAGTAGTLAVFVLTGSMGPMALAAGMGASMGSRYLYKQAVGDVLPDEEELQQRVEQSTRATEQQDAEPQDIGPQADDGSSVEDIGPQTSGDSPDNDDTGMSSNGEDDPFEGIGPAE